MNGGLIEIINVIMANDMAVEVKYSIFGLIISSLLHKKLKKRYIIKSTVAEISHIF